MGNYCAGGRIKEFQDLSSINGNKNTIKLVEDLINQGESCETEGKYFGALQAFSKGLTIYEKEENKNMQVHGYLIFKKAKNHQKLKETDHALKSLKTILAIYTNNYKLKLEEVLAFSFTLY